MARATCATRSACFPAPPCWKGEYGVNGYYMGVPVTIGANGIEKIHQLELTAEEKAMFDRSFQSVKKTVDEIKGQV